MKITAARIENLAPSEMGLLPEVHVTLENGVEMELFHYFPDEVSFREEEFVGLTLQEARELKGRKDREYLRR